MKRAFDGFAGRCIRGAVCACAFAAYAMTGACLAADFEAPPESPATVESEAPSQQALSAQRVALEPIDHQAAQPPARDARHDDGPLPVAVSLVGLVLLLIGVVSLYRRERRRLPPH